MLRDGWYMFGDNWNDKSAGNMPIQGGGADIMRRQVELCEDDNLPGNYYSSRCSLHHEVDHGDWDAVRRFNNHMKQALIDYFPGQETDASMIRTDIYGWGPGFTEDQEIEIEGCGKVFFMDTFIDERAEEEYHKFKRYLFNPPASKVL
jgi:hypothetical protein